MSSERYEKRGVSSDKSEVHHAIKSLDKGIFSNSFCKILEDITCHDPEFCNVMHADTAGTKTNLAYLYWKETQDLSVWEDIVQDALVMNLDDMACSGFTNDFIISSTIGRNKNCIPSDVLSTLINGAQKFAANLKSHGINLYLAGGETADVGDVVRTVDVGFTAFARTKRSNIINIHIQEGDLIVGFASYGQASYESKYNSGIGCNGLTSARHDLFSKYYKDKYPETFDPAIPESLVYSGSKRLTDELEINGQRYHIGKLLLSPTRTFLPVLKLVIESHMSNIHGIIHNTGGGLSKVNKFLPHNLKAVKDKILPIPPIFNLIQSEANISEVQMAEVFNMGTRLEIYIPDEKLALDIIAIAQSFNIEASIIGRVEKK
ncbi:MAG: hypothetical protein RLZZ546_357 [Bacteroidota bacterium]|jgi:phosphoribosylformylglycinamidine cyclo-ligase